MVDDANPATGEVFILSATVIIASEGESAATAVRYHRSTDSTFTSGDTEVGTDSVSALAASGTSNQSIQLAAPLSAGTYYFGACADSVADESDKSAARAVGTGAYALLHTIWFVVMMYLVGFTVVSLPDGSPYPEHYRQTLFGFDWQWIVQLIETSVLILSVYLWVSSLRKLRRRSKGEGRSEVAPQCATLPD